MEHKIIFGKQLAVLLFAGQLLSGYSGNGQAYTCTYTSILTNSGCEQGSFIFDLPANIASDMPFGITDWIALDTSLDGMDDLVSGIALFTHEPTSRHIGFWSILSGDDNPWDFYDELMITFQGGAGNYVSYLLTAEMTAGVFFIADSAAQLNHARLWGTAVTIPLPASVWLFGSGLIGLAAMRRS